MSDRSLGLVLALLVTAVPAFGHSRWNGSVSTDWNTAANWSFGGVPTDTSNMTFSSSVGTSNVN